MDHGGRPRGRTFELGPVYTMDHEVGPWSQLPWSHLKKIKLQTFWPLTRCKLIVDQEEWPCIKKWMCWFLNLCPQKEVLIKFKFDHFFCLSLYLSSLLHKKNSLKYYCYYHFSAMGPSLSLPEHISCLSHCKTYWTKPMDNRVILYFIMTLGMELVVWLTKPSVFG